MKPVMKEEDLRWVNCAVCNSQVLGPDTSDKIKLRTVTVLFRRLVMFSRRRIDGRPVCDRCWKTPEKKMRNLHQLAEQSGGRSG